MHQDLLTPDTPAFKRVYNWISQAKAMAPDLCDWIGIYFKEEYISTMPSSDLLLGPFIGEPTEHTRIPLNRGLCGMALREERVVNAPDVHAYTEHIACSPKTRAELVIPLQDRAGNFVAELDIDSNTPAAFSPELEKRFCAFAEGFTECLANHLEP